MKYARIENNKIREIAQGLPEQHYHPVIAAWFDTIIDDSVEVGAELVDGVWVNPIPEEPQVPTEPPVTYPQLSPLSFKMCFTVSERIAIKALKETDPIIADAFEILDDPRLKVVDLNLQSNQDLIDYLVSLGTITSERATSIKAGTLL